MKHIKKGVTITNKLEQANTFNSFFINIVHDNGMNLNLNTFHRNPESEKTIKLHPLNNKENLINDFLFPLLQWTWF